MKGVIPMRKSYDSKFKAEVAFEILKGEYTITDLTSKAKVHPYKICSWERQFVGNMSSAFDSPRKKAEEEPEITC